MDMYSIKLHNNTFVLLYTYLRFGSETHGRVGSETLFKMCSSIKRLTMMVVRKCCILVLKGIIKLYMNFHPQNQLLNERV